MPFALRLILAWAVDAASLAVAAWIFSGISVGGSAGTLIIAALVYGVLATFVKPALKLLTFPLAIVTLGVAWFFVAMFILWLTDVIVGGLHINGFWTLVGGTVVVWAVGALADHWLFPKRGPMQQLMRASSRFGRA
jgi:putative membrane protein